MQTNMPDDEPPLRRDMALDETIFVDFEAGGEALIRATYGSTEADIDRELLEDAAAALDQAGRSDIGDLVREIAETKASGITRNPYPRSQSTNWHYWNTSWIRKRARKTGESFEETERRAIETIDE
jgi:hypothetical protein